MTFKNFMKDKNYRFIKNSLNEDLEKLGLTCENYWSIKTNKHEFLIFKDYIDIIKNNRILYTVKFNNKRILEKLFNYYINIKKEVITKGLVYLFSL